MIRRFLHDESGQSLILAAFTFFALVVVALLVYGVGEATSAQMELQNAADTAAYAGGQVLADSVAQIAWTNEAMSKVYYHGMRYAVDVTALGTLTEFRYHTPEYGSFQAFSNVYGGTPSTWEDRFAAPEEIIGVANVEERYAEAYQQADEWIPRCQAWLIRLSRIQRGIAVLAPEAVKCQIAYTALQNGAERFAYYPEFTLIPEEASRREVSLEHFTMPNYGWRIWSETDGYEFTAMHLPQVGPFGDPPKVTDKWTADLTEAGKDDVHMDVSSTYYCDPDGTNWQTEGADHEILTTIGEDTIRDWVHVFDTEHTIHKRWVNEEIVIDDELTVEENEDGTEYEINDVVVQQNNDGSIEYWDESCDTDGDGEADPAEMVDLPETTTIDGVEVPIDYDIDGGGGIQLVYPIRIHMRQAILTLVEPVRIDFGTPCGLVHVRDERATLNGLSTASPSDQWERVYSGDGGRDYGGRSDRTYHRLRTVEPDQEWIYEWMRFGSYMENMPMDALAMHAIQDFDPHYADNGGTVWERYPASTEDERWNLYPRWARANRIEAGIEEAVATGTDYDELDYGGWFDIARGRPHTYEGEYTAYSQTRECWFCGTDTPITSATNESTLVDYNPESPTYGQECERPAGFWHEDLSALDSTQRQARADAMNAQFGFSPDAPNRPVRNISLDKPGHVQVMCPVCARAWNAGASPGDGHEWMAGPPFQASDLQLHQAPSFVRKYAAHALGRKGEIGYLPDDARHDNPLARSLTIEDRMSIRPAETYNPDTWQPPLRLTAEFFRKGFIVGTWKSTAGGRVFSMLGGRSSDPGEKRMGVRNPFPTDIERDPILRGHGAWSGASSQDRARWLWGHFGIAACRPIFWNDTEFASPTQATTFGWEGVQPLWITDDPADIDPLGREINWWRQEWIRGPMNLFDPDWDARIVPMRRMLDLRDVYTTEGDVPDTELSFMFDELAKEPWPDNIVDLHRSRRHYSSRNPEWEVMRNFRRMSAPPLLGGNEGNAVNYDDEDLDEVVRH
jgi:hypothetical protein